LPRFGTSALRRIDRDLSFRLAAKRGSPQSFSVCKSRMYDPVIAAKSLTLDTANGQALRPGLVFARRKSSMGHSWLLVGMNCLAVLSVLWRCNMAAAYGDVKDLADSLRSLEGNVWPREGEKAKELRQMVGRHVRAKIQAVNQRDSSAWKQVKDRTDWEKFRDTRLVALRASLGQFPQRPTDLKVRVTRSLEKDHYRIENLVFESRPGLWVTANLYQPARPSRSMPGILICHSHHNPKSQGELQDMGVTWARLGCLVLVMDQLGHGERRLHPFVDPSSFAGSFRVGRQDYYFRYNAGMQLHVVGDSLMGWMVWDLTRGVDLILARTGIDKDRIILLGAVAGGGDPAAVTAALDRRIAAVAPFNFGGPQPETVFPLPAEAETKFNYAGSGSWESTRNLRLSARDDFLPWVIVGAVAPRRLIYAHEFAWDREHDPVWSRLEQIYGFYGARDHLAAVHGRGSVTGKPPDATHCNNIGPEHLRQIYPMLKRWFDIPVPDQGAQKRSTAEELTCFTPEAAKELKPRPFHELIAELAIERADTARKRYVELAPRTRQQRLRQEWANLLGDVDPKGEPKIVKADRQALGAVTVERLSLEVEPGIDVPLLLLVPERKAAARMPVVVAFAQHGKQAFLKERPAALAKLLNAGTSVCLPDLRGTAETGLPDSARGRSSASTSLSATELMLGQTLVGARLRDLRSVLRHLRGRTELDPRRVALWGDSFAPANRQESNLAVPLDADRLPEQSEPLGGVLALLGALFEEDIRAVYARRGLVGYRSVLASPFCYVPHDGIIPGALTAGDLCDIAAGLAPRPVRLEGLVDGLNREVSVDTLTQTFEPARQAYRSEKAEHCLQLGAGQKEAEAAIDWLLRQLAAD
jgi:dienelactone hydrolase